MPSGIRLLDCKALVIPFVFTACVQGSLVTFRGLGKWRALSVESILSSEVSAAFDEGHVRGYYSDPRRVALEALAALAAERTETQHPCGSAADELGKWAES